MKKLTLIIAVLFAQTIYVQSQTTEFDNKPTVFTAHLLGISQPLSEIAPLIDNIVLSEEEKEHDNFGHKGQAVIANPLPHGEDPVWQKTFSDSRGGNNTFFMQNEFDGLDSTGIYPPDPSGDIGTNHYIQMTNSSNGSQFVIFDKTGNIVYGPTSTNTMWTQFGQSGLGDPIVLYDQDADRWLITELSIDFTSMLVAVSATNDPMGSWYSYQYMAPGLPDYPKYSMWENAYMACTNEAGWNGVSPVYVWDRQAMLIGSPSVTVLRFTVPSFGAVDIQALSGVDWMGNNSPPVNSEPMLLRLEDDAYGQGPDRLQMWTIHLDWTTPGNSVLNQPVDIPVSPFDAVVCSGGWYSCTPQPGGSYLSALDDVLMYRVHYRNFGAYESIVCCHMADVNGSDLSGIRWYEIRRVGGGAWLVHQEGTYAPDNDHRIHANIAQDGYGNIALGYTVSSGTQMPDLRITGRRAGDPLGQMTIQETTIGVSTQPNAYGRMGDYSAMTVDPVDNKTFWFTGEYFNSPLGDAWRTRIASFFISSDTNDIGPTMIINPISQSNLTSTEQIIVNVTNFGFDPQTNFDISYRFENGPVVMENVNTNLASGGTYTHTFGSTVDMSTIGEYYDLEIFTALATDTAHFNDTIHAVIRNIPMYDVDVISITSNQMYCAAAANIPISIFNQGTATITSLDIEYQLNVGNIQTYTWNGSANQNTLFTVALPVSNIMNGQNLLYVNATEINGNADQFPADNTLSTTLMANTLGGGININITTDYYPYETTWELYDASNNVVASGGSYQNPNSLIITDVCLIPGCYQFIIYDQYGDGIYSPGGYTITLDANDSILAQTINPYFGYQENNSFCIPGCALNVSTTTTDETYPGAEDGSITVTSTGGTAPYLFSIDGTIYQSSNIFDNLAGGTYVIIVTDASGCYYTVQATVITGNGNGIEPIQQNDFAVVYPNPVDENLYITLIAEDDEINMQLFNSLGQMIRNELHQVIAGNVNTLQLKMNDLATGVYFLKLNSGEKEQLVEVVKK